VHTLWLIIPTLPHGVRLVQSKMGQDRFQAGSVDEAGEACGVSSLLFNAQTPLILGNEFVKVS